MLLRHRRASKRHLPGVWRCCVGLLLLCGAFSRRGALALVSWWRWQHHNRCHLRQSSIGSGAPAHQLGMRLALRATATETTYGDPEYWEERFRTRDKGSYVDKIDDRGVGWLCGYTGPLRETLHAVTGGEMNSKIMNIGCGVDQLSEEIYADGFHNLVSCDYSQSAIEEMRQRTATSMPKAEWEVENAMKMRAKTQDFDVVIDKGTLDSILAGPDPVQNGVKMLREVQRILGVGGTYLLVTHARGDPRQYRLPLLSLPHLQLDINLTPDMGGYFIFVCRKLDQLQPADEAKAWAIAQEWAKAEDIEGERLAAEALQSGAVAPPFTVGSGEGGAPYGGSIPDAGVAASYPVPSAREDTPQ